MYERKNQKEISIVVNYGCNRILQVNGNESETLFPERTLKIRFFLICPHEKVVPIKILSVFPKEKRAFCQKFSHLTKLVLLKPLFANEVDFI